MQEYDFNVEFCPGKDNIVADALSRFPKPGNEEEKEQIDVEELGMFGVALESYGRKQTINLKELQKEQENDEVVMKIKAQLEKGLDWFMLYEGILFKKELDGCKIVVPANLVLPLVQTEHQSFGHFGSQKVLSALRRWFWWKKMRSQVIKIVRSCDLCQKAKISKYGRGPMSSVVPKGPHELGCIDLMGPLPKSRGGVVFLLVIIDAFSKHVRLYPLKRATTRTIVNKVKIYVEENGPVQCLLSDNGTQFRSVRWSEELSKLNIRVAFTSVYFPQGNMTERINREIGRLLRSMCFAQHTRWAYVIPEVEELLNNVLHESTGFTPNEIHVQQQRVFPCQDIKFPTAFKLPPRDQIIMLARERLQTKAMQRQIRHSKKGPIVQFQVGDRVYVRTHPQSSVDEKKIRKFFLLFDGPYVVAAQRGPNSYELRDGSGQCKGTHNVYNLKKCQPAIGVEAYSQSPQQGGNVPNVPPMGIEPGRET